MCARKVHGVLSMFCFAHCTMNEWMNECTTSGAVICLATSLGAADALTAILPLIASRDCNVEFSKAFIFAEQNNNLNQPQPPFLSSSKVD